MNKIITSILVLISVSSCSLLGSSSSEGVEGYDPLTEGNIPLAQAGSDSELKDINFGYNSSVLSSASRARLKDNYKWLSKNSSVSVTIEGHCDERGTSEYNLVLGQRRAQIVKEYLVTAGIDSSRLEIQSYGEELPLVPGLDENTWQQNRRAHFKIN